MSVSIRMGEFFSGWVFQLERVGSSSQGGCFNNQITGGFFSRGGCFNDQQVRSSLGVGVSMIKGQVRFSLRWCLFQ